NLVFTIGQLQAINSNVAGNYALGQNIDATGFTGFIPIGAFASLTGPFSGTFNGLGNVVANLVITNPNNGQTGLFGASTGTIANLGLVGGWVTDTTDTDLVGGLAGDNAGTIKNSYSTASVTASGIFPFVGGLVGANELTGKINDSYA